MIANSFELQKDRSHDQSPQRNFDLSRAFNGLTESCAMGKTRIPGDALREKHGSMYRQFLKEFFPALMRIEHAKLQMEERVTGYREIERARLASSSMDGTDWHLNDPLTQS